MSRRHRPHWGHGPFARPWQGQPDFGPGQPDPRMAMPPRGPRGPFGGFPWGGPFGGGPFGDDPGGRRRHRRGDIKYALLELLVEQPRHGYELIKALEERYGGFYRPSPGTVYPTLQLLEDEGHLTSETIDGKKVYSVTESGRKLLEERRAGEPGGRWGRGPMGGPRPELHELRERSMALMGVLQQVGQHGTPEQLRAAAEQLDATRRALYQILAETGSQTDPNDSGS